jgi:hypothetical protein
MKPEQNFLGHSTAFISAGTIVLFISDVKSLAADLALEIKKAELWASEASSLQRLLVSPIL